MALQILPAVDRGPSRGEKVANALRGTMDILSNYKEKADKKAIMEKENQAFKSQGLDLYGIDDPKTRQLIVSAKLQGANAQQLEELKQNAKQQRIQENQGFISKLFGNKQPQGMSPADEMRSGQERMPQNQTQQPEEQGMPFDVSEITPEQIAQITAQDPMLGKALQSEKDVALREKREVTRSKERLEAQKEQTRTNKEKAFFKFNEPKLAEVAGIERKIQVDNARFSRLEDLFTDNSKFPHQTLAALMTKDGQLNDVAYSQLSPEAQEAVKLIIDSTSGIKDTYGARVTNFDLQTFLRKLPSLMTSPEGRMRVIRDLKNINDINSVYNEGIQDIFEKAGGSDKISYSEAERKFKKEYGSELQRKIDKFIEPDQKNFNEMPSPKKFLGKKVMNENTGEIFISDGNEWKPFEG
jgi:hypothetical protein